MLVRFGKTWGQDGLWAIECGDWNFERMTDLLDYYGVRNYKGVAYEDYLDKYGKIRTGITYEGEATLNIETETNYKL